MGRLSDLPRITQLGDDIRDQSWALTTNPLPHWPHTILVRRGILDVAAGRSPRTTARDAGNSETRHHLPPFFKPTRQLTVREDGLSLQFYCIKIQLLPSLYCLSPPSYFLPSDAATPMPKPLKTLLVSAYCISQGERWV